MFCTPSGRSQLRNLNPKVTSKHVWKASSVGHMTGRLFKWEYSWKGTYEQRGEHSGQRITPYCLNEEVWGTDKVMPQRLPFGPNFSITNKKQVYLGNIVSFNPSFTSIEIYIVWQLCVRHCKSRLLERQSLCIEEA